MRLNSDSKLFKLSVLFPDSHEDPCSSGWESPRPGRPTGGSGGHPRSFRRTDTGRFVLGIPRSEATFPHRAAKLQAAPERLITADKHPPETQRRHVTAAITGYTQTSQTLTPRAAARILTAPQTSVNIWQQKFTRNAPRLVSNLCRRSYENICFSIKIIKYSLFLSSRHFYILHF